MARQRAMEVLRRELRDFGVARTAFDLGFRALNRCVHFKILRVVTIESPHADYHDTGGALAWQFFTPAQLRALCRNPENDLSESFLDLALARGDRCFGVLHGAALASYGWYSNQATEVEGAVLHFPPERIYMYKAFTLPRYRGQRLHARGMNLALEHFLAMGYQGFVSCIEANNFSSLRSFARLGYRRCGSAVICKVGDRRLIHTSSGCRRQGLLFTRPAKDQDGLSSWRPAPADLAEGGDLSQMHFTTPRADVSDAECDTARDVEAAAT